jgi:hypothetical protein
MLVDVAFGSIASISADPSEVRFTPDSDRMAEIRKATLSADCVAKVVLHW